MKVSRTMLNKLGDWLQDNYEDILAVVMAIFVLAILSVMAYTAAQAVTLSLDNGTCLSHGYREAKLAPDWKAYCIKTVNQTDVVVPLQELK